MRKSLSLKTNSLFESMHISRVWAAMALFSVASCKTSTPPQKEQAAKPVILELGQHSYTTEDFSQSFLKNRLSADSAKALSAKEYFDLYTNLKLKVLAAQQEGRDTTADFKEEISSYKEILSKNYLTDKALVEQFANEAYQRLKEELKVSHILIPVAQDATPADTLSAYNAAFALHGRLLEGADFGEMAEKFSKDPTAATNKGNLGYFTAFQMIYPFENAAYKTEIGKITPPVRSRFGYQIIKVHEKRPSRGKVQVAHIMARINPQATSAARTEAKKKIDEAYQLLKKGESWDKVVETYSDDAQSKKNKGLLPMFGTGEMMPSFEDAAFALVTPGAYSQPIQTPYGWHILQLVALRPLETYEVMAQSLRQKVVTDSRGKLIEKAVATKLRGQYRITENQENWNQVSSYADSTLLKASWKAPKLAADQKDRVLFSVENSPTTEQSFLDFVQTRQEQLPGASPKVVFQRLYTEFQDRRLQTYARENLETNNKEFRDLMNEIREGVLLSQVMEKNVWQKSLDDSLAQREIYNKTVANYSYPERAVALRVIASDTAVLNQARKMLSQSPYLLQRKANELLFAKGKTAITPELREKLADLVVIMTKNPDYVVEVAAYRAKDENDSVSSVRLRNAVYYLNYNNIPITRIIEKDHGPFRPVAEADRNRRVSFQFFSSSKKDVEKVLNDGAPNSVSIVEAYINKQTTDQYLKDMRWQTGEQSYQKNGKSVWIQVKGIEQARNKTFEEARGAVINEYQKILEKQWLDSLKTSFPIKVNEQELEKLDR